MHMTHSLTVRSTRKAVRATNVTLDAALVTEAKELGVSISQASNQGLQQAVKKARGERWLEENKAALESSNAWVEKHGLPLAKYRMF
jgi:antitoxin CcdA